MPRAQGLPRERGKRAKRRATKLLSRGLLLGSLLAPAIASLNGCRPTAEETVAPVEVMARDSAQASASPKTEELRVRVLRKYPHAKDAFTQGLIWQDGHLFESTGQYGRSSLRRVRLKDGQVLAERKLDSKFFGEGLARVGNRLIQLTWRSGVAIVSDYATLEQRELVRYRGEGWGLCYNGSELVMSDGSSILEFRDPDTLAVIREITVVMNGRAVSKLNELECVGTTIYANIWQRDEILRIDAKTGRVTARIDASRLLSRVQSLRADVLNGIAYKPDSKTFLVTGKFWPHVFEVDFTPR